MSFLNYTKLFFVVLGISVLTFQGCKSIDPDVDRPKASEFSSEVFLKWNELFMEIDRYAFGYRPGPGPRSLGYMGLSAYESIVAGMPDNNSMKYHYVGLDIPEATNDEYYWPACVNESYAYLMKRFMYHIQNTYPDLYNKIEATRLTMHNQFANETPADVLERSEKYGLEVAKAVFEWEKTDEAGHDAFLNPRPADYVPPVGAGLWAPTFPDFGKAMFPYWGKVRTFAITAQDKLARAPLPYSEDPNSLFYAQAEETYKRVNNIKSNGPNAYEERWLAEFWSDDNLGLTFGPPTRLVAIADQIVDRENVDLGTAAELYAKMGMALSDAGVALWNSKYYYNVERPVSYIRRVLVHQYPAAANWTTILNDPYNNVFGMTPAFPAYPSGHSGFGGAGANIISSFFENTGNYPGTYTFTDNCHFNRTEFNGTPRTFASLKDMANEDAYSRIPLGVHFRMDCDEGIRLGEVAAQRVLDLPWKQ